MNRRFVSGCSFSVMALVLLVGTTITSMEVSTVRSASLQGGAGPLDFLKAQDASFALVVNSSGVLTAEGPKLFPDRFPDGLWLLAGLPDNPQLSGPFNLPFPVASIVLSPDGDTALAASVPVPFFEPSSLAVLGNIKAFVESRDPDDLQITVFTSEDMPQLANVTSLAYGPDGRWAVMGSNGPGPFDPSARNARLYVVTGLPDTLAFSDPIPLHIAQVERFVLTLDGDTLLVTQSIPDVDGRPESRVLLIRGIAPGGADPQIVDVLGLPFPDEFVPWGPPTLDDAKLTLDGRFILAPNPLATAFDPATGFQGLNTITIIGGVEEGQLEVARVLTEADGAGQGPLMAAVSPDGDTALVIDTFPPGGGTLLTGLASGDPAQVEGQPIPPFGPAFPLGPDGPPVMAFHNDVYFTPDGNTAIVTAGVAPGLPPQFASSVSVLTGFGGGNIQVVANLTDPELNIFLPFNQHMATVPSGLVDYINISLAQQDLARSTLVTQVESAIRAADRGDTDDAVQNLNLFIATVANFNRQGILADSQATTLTTLASVGIKMMQQ